MGQVKRQLDRFILAAPLGSSATQFSAQETLPLELSRPVLVELLPELEARDKQAPERLREKFTHLLTLAGHPNIATILAVGLAERVPYLALAYAPGTLESFVTDKPALSTTVRRFLEQMAAALAHMHTRTPALLHHNLCPESVHVDAAGSFTLAGLGLLAPESAEPTCPLHMVRFAAPELLQRELGRVGPATDLYALGHLACLLALGRKLCRAQFPQVYEEVRGATEAPPAKWMQWHCSLPTAAPQIQALVPEFPAALSAIIQKLMAKAQADRYASATDLLRELTEAAHPAPVESAPRAAPSAAHAAPARGSAASGGEESPQRYYVRLRERTSGPFDLPTLQRHVRQGLISRLHQVSTDQVAWRPATSIEGLFGH